MINDKLKVLEVAEIKDLTTPITRGNVVRILFEKKDELHNTFTDNEYLKLDMTNGEFVGLKSTSTFLDKPISDLAALDYLIRNSDKYKAAEMLNLGNINDLFKKNEEVEQK